MIVQQGHQETSDQLNILLRTNSSSLLYRLAPRLPSICLPLQFLFSKLQPARRKLVGGNLPPSVRMVTQKQGLHTGRCGDNWVGGFQASERTNLKRWLAVQIRTRTQASLRHLSVFLNAVDSPTIYSKVTTEPFPFLSTLPQPRLKFRTQRHMIGTFRLAASPTGFTISTHL